MRDTPATRATHARHIPDVRDTPATRPIHARHFPDKRDTWATHSRHLRHARHMRDTCATHRRHMRDTFLTSATHARHMRDTSLTNATHVRLMPEAWARLPFVHLMLSTTHCRNTTKSEPSKITPTTFGRIATVMIAVPANILGTLNSSGGRLQKSPSSFYDYLSHFGH